MIGLKVGITSLRRRGVDWLLYDGFDTPAVAPLASPRTCEPTGTLTIVDTGAHLSIANGILTPDGALAGAGDPKAMTAGQARKAGLAAIFRTRQGGTARGNFGWTASATPTTYPDLGKADSSGNYNYTGDGAGLVGVGPTGLIGGDYHDTIPVLRSAGGWLLERIGTSGVYTLVWVGNVTNTATMYAGTWARATNYSIYTDFLKLVDLGTYDSRFASDYGLATSRLVSPAANATATMQADAVLEFTHTQGASDTNIYLRQQDPNNLWMIQATSAGTLNFMEKNAGTWTARISVASTFTNAQVYRTVVVAQGNTYTVYVNNVQKGVYTDPSNLFLTATTVTVSLVGGGVSEFIAWPRFVALPAEVA